MPYQQRARGGGGGGGGGIKKKCGEARRWMKKKMRREVMKWLACGMWVITEYLVLLLVVSEWFAAVRLGLAFVGTVLMEVKGC